MDVNDTAQINSFIERWNSSIPSTKEIMKIYDCDEPEAKYVISNRYILKYRIVEKPHELSNKNLPSLLIETINNTNITRINFGVIRFILEPYEDEDLLVLATYDEDPIFFDYESQEILTGGDYLDTKYPLMRVAKDFASFLESLLIYGRMWDDKSLRGINPTPEQETSLYESIGGREYNYLYRRLFKEVLMYE